MRNPLSLAWWILILGVLQLASLILDRYHFLLWGKAGYLFLKTSYLAFAAVLLVRFLSFRRRKSFESLVDSYNRVSGQPWAPPQGVMADWRKYLFYMGLLVVSSANFLTSFAWGALTFRFSILLDLVFWLLALRWVTRAHWLKALGLREKLKAGLDDARSRLGSPAGLSAFQENGVSRWPFLTLFGLAMGVTLALSAYRWGRAEPVYRIADLKGCLLECLDRGVERFHREGRLAEGLSKESCLSGHREKVDVTLGFQRGELLLMAIEKPGFDYFGNGKPGDQGLMLDAESRFRSTGR